MDHALGRHGSTQESLSPGHALRLLVALAALLASCGGEGGACRTRADCSGDLECQVADPPQVCGIPCGATRTCESDADCIDGDVCVDVAQPCCGPTEVGTQCQPPCADDAACPDGASCTDGRCAVPACATDADCGTHFLCDASSANDVYDGCVRRGCAEDADCGEGVCVQGGCWDVTGSCEEPALVP